MKKRVDYFDYVKGLLIILIFFGHLTPEKVWWRKIIFCTALPAFFMISGMIIAYSGGVKKKFFQKNVIGIVWPYLCFSLIGVLMEYYRSGFNLAIAKNIFVQQISFWRGSIWFLPSLFVAKTLAELLILKFPRITKIIIPTGILILSITSNLIQYHEYFTNIAYSTTWHIINFSNKTLIGMIFVLAGFYLFPLTESFSHKLPRIVPALVMIGCAGLSLCTGMVDLNNSKIHNPIIFWFNAIIGSIGLIVFFSQIKTKLKLLQYYGTNSLIMMATTTVFPIVELSKSFAGSWGLTNNFLVMGLFGTLIEFIIIRIIDKSFPWLKKFPVT